MLVKPSGEVLITVRSTLGSIAHILYIKLLASGNVYPSELFGALRDLISLGGGNMLHCRYKHTQTYPRSPAQNHLSLINITTLLGILFTNSGFSQGNPSCSYPISFTLLETISSTLSTEVFTSPATVT